MKSKTKIGALTLALALAGGALIGCNQNPPAPAPEPEKYFVQYTTSTDYNITGINSDGYVKGADVEFRVTVTNEKKEISSVKYDTTTITAVGGLYSFKMPEKDVRLYVTLNNKADIVVTYSGTLKKGQTVTFTVNDQDGDPAEDVSIEGNSSEVEINGTQVKFLTHGDIDLTFNGNGLSKEITYTVADAVHGETIDNPLTVDEAVEIAHALDISFSAKKQSTDQYGTPYNVPSDIEYYIEGYVNPNKEITFKSGSNIVEPSAAKNVTCYLMGTDFDFELYATSGSNNLHRQVDAYSKVIVKTHIINFGYGEWTGDNKDVPHATTDKDKGQPETFKDYDTSVYPDIVSVDNTELKGLKLELEAQYSVLDGTFTLPVVRQPAAASGLLTYTVEPASKGTVDENGVVTMLEAGEVTITVRYSDTVYASASTVFMAGAVASEVYKLDATVAVTDDSAHTASNYSKAYDITRDGVIWSPVANITMSPWRFGGKSITNEGRTLTSKSVVSTYDIERVEVELGDIFTDCTFNSLTIKVGTAEGLSDVSTETVNSPAGNTTVVFSRPSETSWASRYFTFVFNVTVSVSSNKCVQLKSVTFFAQTAE